MSPAGSSPCAGNVAMPVEMVRAMLVNTPLTRDYEAQWLYRGAKGNVR